MASSDEVTYYSTKDDTEISYTDPDGKARVMKFTNGAYSTKKDAELAILDDFVATTGHPVTGNKPTKGGKS